MSRIIRNILAVTIFIIPLFAFGQEKSFTVEISTDSIYFGNSIEVRFTAKNISGQFEAPDFEGFEIVGGPNTSTNMSFINGEMSSTSSYSYFLKPRATGSIFITESYYQTSEELFETQAIQIEVLDNPDGIMEDPQLGNDLKMEAWPKIKPKKPKKKKYKTRRI